MSKAPDPGLANPRRRRSYRTIWRVLGCFFFVCVATCFGLPAGKGGPGAAVFIWLANGILLSYLLLAPRRTWPAYLAAGFVAHLAVLPFLHGSITLGLLFSPHDPLEVWLAAFLMRRRSSELPDFTGLRYLKRFTLYVLIVASGTVSTLYALLTKNIFHLSFLHNFVSLFTADAIGLMVSTPACVAIFRAQLRKTFGLPSLFLYGCLIVAANLLFFTQVRIPVTFVLIPLLLLVLLRWGLGWASLGALAAAGIGSWCTASGMGPFAALQHPSFLPAGMLLQLFIISAVVVLYSVSVVVENLRDTERRLQRVANLHKLIAENSRDLIMLIDSGGRRIISSPNRLWGGWTRQELGAYQMGDLVHPEDREHLMTVVRELSAGKDGDLLEYRARGKDGDYLWVESNMRCVRDPVTGAPAGVLATIREIGDRKQAEENLREAYRTAEALAITDPLTDLGNRRRFEEFLLKEWRRTLREKRPLSLLLIDADSFKTYNDMYGHRSGDECLKEIAYAVGAGAARPADLASRIGGDEFALLLPNTDEDGAARVAQKIAGAVHARAIAHEGSPTGCVSVSIGCGTLIPQAGQPAALLFDLADEALYAAKGSGRNKICSRSPAKSVDQSGALQPAPESSN